MKQYPPLVEQAYIMLRAQGIETTRLELFNLLIQEDFLDYTGKPTQYAIDQGFIQKIDRGDMDGLDAISQDPSHDPR